MVWVLAAWGGVLVALAVAAGLTALVRSDNGEPDLARARRETRAYAADVDALARQAGLVVVEGIKPGLADLESGRITAAEFRANATGWRASMDRVHRELSALRPPPSLGPAADAFDQALRQYARAIDAFVEASRAPRDRLTGAIGAAAAVAERADALYDRADALVQTEFRRLGLPARASLP